MYSSYVPSGHSAGCENNDLWHNAGQYVHSVHRHYMLCAGYALHLLPARRSAKGAQFVQCIAEKMRPLKGTGPFCYIAKNDGPAYGKVKEATRLTRRAESRLLTGIRLFFVICKKISPSKYCKTGGVFICVFGCVYFGFGFCLSSIFFTTIDNMCSQRI